MRVKIEFTNGNIEVAKAGEWRRWSCSRYVAARQLDTMRKDLLVISFGEELAEDIIKLLEENK